MELLNNKWYQSILLPDGTYTPGERPPNAWEVQGLPERVDGLSVLDIGASEGYFSFEAERRGASYIHAVDQWDVCTDGGTSEWYRKRTKANFEFAHASLKSKVVFTSASVCDWSGPDQPADLVVFSQVLYHLEDPIIVLRKIRKWTAGKCYFETAGSLDTSDEPVMRFNRDPVVVHDLSTFWLPNKKCVYSLVEHVGFRVEREVFVFTGLDVCRVCLVLS